MLAKKTMSYEEIADFVEVLSIDDIRALDANKTA